MSNEEKGGERSRGRGGGKQQVTAGRGVCVFVQLCELCVLCEYDGFFFVPIPNLIDLDSIMLHMMKRTQNG